MKRREVLAVCAASTLLGGAGCTDGLEQLGRNGHGSNDVPGCTSRESWPDDSTGDVANPDPGSIADRRDWGNAERPESTGDVCKTFEITGEEGETTEFHSVDVRPYPEPPAAFDAETLGSFAAEYERAYAQNSAVSNHGGTVVKFPFTVSDTRPVNVSDGITVGAIEFGYRRERERGPGGYTDAFGEVAVYGIDETGVARADADYFEDGRIDPAELPDPVEDGDLLQCF